MEPDRAVISALLEMCQMEISFEILRRTGPQVGGQGLAMWNERASLDSCTHCLPGDTHVDLRTYRLTDHEDNRNLAGRCAEICANHDLRLFYADLTREEIGVPVARVIVPGLRHYLPRFAPGRLYDVPAKLGWPASGLDESTLHPLPLIV
jgi:ribosomal protein S12 methylthiotransferase accessory factor